MWNDFFYNRPTSRCGAPQQVLLSTASPILFSTREEGKKRRKKHPRVADSLKSSVYYNKDLSIWEPQSLIYPKMSLGHECVQKQANKWKWRLKRIILSLLMFIHSHVVPNPYAGVCFCFFLGAQIFMEPFLIKVHSVHNFVFYK